jgi:hypothetical protein
LRQRITNFPVLVDTFARKLRADGGQAFVQTRLEAADFVVFVV